MGVAVARQKAFKSQNIAAIRPPDDDRAAAARFQQSYTAQYKGAHNAFAQVGILHQQIPQPARSNHQRFDRLQRVSIHQRWAVGQLREFTHEMARSMGRDMLAAAALIVLGNLDTAGIKHEKSWRDFACCHDALAGRIRFPFAKPLKECDLFRFQRGKHLRTPQFHDGLQRLSHECLDKAVRDRSAEEL